MSIRDHIKKAEKLKRPGKEQAISHPSSLNSRRRGTKIQKLLEKYGNKCWICKGQFGDKSSSNDLFSITIDHVIRLADGGTHDISNLRLAHKMCNEKRGHNMEMKARKMRTETEEKEQEKNVL